MRTMANIIAAVRSGQRLQPAEKAEFFGLVNRHMRDIGGKFPDPVNDHWPAVRNWLSGEKHSQAAGGVVADYFSGLLLQQPVAQAAEQVEATPTVTQESPPQAPDEPANG